MLGMRIGLYGGSFDPVHLGHLLVAAAALEEFDLDQVVFIPAAQSPFKPQSRLADAAHRLRWLRLALAGQARFRVDDLEILRGGVSYTIDTVRHYASIFPQANFCCLIGEDHLEQLPRWREADALAGAVEFILVPRPGSPEVHPPKGFRVHRLRGNPLSVSSSEIRDRVKAGRRIDHLVPEAVARDIAQNRLYLG